MPASVVSPDASFYVKIEDMIVYDDDGNLATKSDQVVANGSIEFEPTVDFRLRIRNWQVEELYLQLTPRRLQTGVRDQAAEIADRERVPAWRTN